MSLGWTDDRVKALTTLWVDGLSASQIARQLGGVTRNAVIGKVHRLGLSGRAAPSRPGRAPTSNPRPRRAAPAHAHLPAVRRPAARPPRPGQAPAPAPAPELPGTATAMTLGAHMCKWPIGDPSSREFSFCGRGVEDRGPYCLVHHRIANPAKPPKSLEHDPVVRRILARWAA